MVLVITVCKYSSRLFCLSTWLQVRLCAFLSFNKIREASQALLQAELRRIGPLGRKDLVNRWCVKLPSPSSFKATSEKKQHFAEDIDDGSIVLPPELAQQPATQQQQATAVIILGMVGAEFSADGKSLKKSAAEMGGKKVQSVTQLEVMDPAIARHTAKTLQAVLLEKPSSKTGLYSNLRCSAAELLGRGFNLWEKYVDIPEVIMGLLDLAVQYSAPAAGTEEGKGKTSSSKTMKFVSDVAKKALNLMVLLRPSTVVTTLAKEVGLFITSQHHTPALHSSLPPVQVCDCWCNARQSIRFVPSQAHELPRAAKERPSPPLHARNICCRIPESNG